MIHNLAHTVMSFSLSIYGAYLYEIMCFCVCARMRARVCARACIVLTSSVTWSARVCRSASSLRMSASSAMLARERGPQGVGTGREKEAQGREKESTLLSLHTCKGNAISASKPSYRSSGQSQCSSRRNRLSHLHFSGDFDHDQSIPL